MLHHETVADETWERRYLEMQTHINTVKERYRPLRAKVEQELTAT